jgi:hypothetical protein
MDKAHEIQKIDFVGATMSSTSTATSTKLTLRIGRSDLQRRPRIRERFEVSPAGYGIHWPDLDEDLSIDGLIGVKHSSPVAETAI